MEFHFLTPQVVQVQSEGIVIAKLQDAVDLVGNCFYQGAKAVILEKRQIVPSFFDLKTGFAGEVLQKFSNYQIRFAIVGNFSDTNSQSLKDFIYESKKGKRINFVASWEEAIHHLSE